MKTTGLLLALLLPVFVHAQDKSYVIDGKIKTDSVLVGKIYLYGKGIKRDSCVLKNNTYHFANILEPEGAQAVITWCDAPDEERIRKTGSLAETGAIFFFLSPGNIRIEHELAFDKKTITGSPLQVEYDNVVKAIRASNGDKDPVLKEYIRSHPNSWLSFAFLRDRARYFGPEVADSLYRSLSDNLKKDPEIKKLDVQLTAAVAVGIGKIAPEFTLNDPEGKPVSLSSYRGKYVLVDFWASWCVPCRAESPYVKRAYDVHKSKGLEILGISLDTQASRDKWIEAIKKDGLTWTQVSDLVGPESPVAKAYGVEGIPANFLIDPLGKVIAVNLRGGDVELKIAQLVK
ncbi:redoxin domain-containing protein [Chitinophaga sp. SYP-B3965]|uniref:TlpA disulfide reductase family protein n=1 Tax=Chitinophaga sp. SYP-B3965 TaxID=2663120 RepID=UPI0012999B3C|nr:TlpA disulfide reductase family protein [Chitinophaga sp. SYP-B3965]MRG44124.1 redoxin domain-containing protein [Chitinophaga sp. SYP-B3965]